MLQEKRLLRVPWGGDTVVQVMFFWLLAFCFLGSCVVPVALDLLGLDRMDLTPRLKARVGSRFRVGGLFVGGLSSAHMPGPSAVGVCLHAVLRLHGPHAPAEGACRRRLAGPHARLSCCRWTACTAQICPAQRTPH